MPQVVTVSTTRSATWRSDHSRSSVFRVPRKYFWARMLVAFRLQVGHLDVRAARRPPPVPVVGDPGVASLPDDLVVGMDTGGGEVAADADADRWGAMAM
jgi:hypothetical protein